MWLGGRKEGNGYQGNLMDGTGGDDGHSCVDRGERLRRNAGTSLEAPNDEFDKASSGGKRAGLKPGKERSQFGNMEETRGQDPRYQQFTNKVHPHYMQES